MNCSRSETEQAPEGRKWTPLLWRLARRIVTGRIIPSHDNGSFSHFSCPSSVAGQRAYLGPPCPVLDAGLQGTDCRQAQHPAALCTARDGHNPEPWSAQWRSHGYSGQARHSTSREPPLLSCPPLGRLLNEFV